MARRVGSLKLDHVSDCCRAWLIKFALACCAEAGWSIAVYMASEI